MDRRNVYGSARNRERRREYQKMIYVGPTGNTVRGDVLDVNVKAFERALKHYDPLLYVTWNPKKIRGWGCWEIRRKPTYKTAIYQGTWKGQSFFRLHEVEFKTIHHVLDCAFLNYDALRKLKEMDAFNKDHWIHDLEYRERKQAEQVRAKALENLRYNLKQEKTAMRDILEAVKSGVNPAQILSEVEWDS